MEFKGQFSKTVKATRINVVLMAASLDYCLLGLRNHHFHTLALDDTQVEFNVKATLGALTKPDMTGAGLSCYLHRYLVINLTVILVAHLKCQQLYYQRVVGKQAYTLGNILD